MTGLFSRRALATATIVALLSGYFPFINPSFVHADPSPEPAVSVDAPAGAFLNERFQISIEFDNAGDATGFGPVVELLVPPGVDLDPGSASFLGMPVTVYSPGVFDGSGLLTNPLTGLDVSGPAGWLLLVIQIPLGSFTVDQPPAVVEMSAEFNVNAALGNAERFYANPLFQFGADAEDNPTVDPPVHGSQSTSDVVPTVITLQKSNDARENETATGPNFPVTYTLTVDIAKDAKIEGLTVTDVLPGNLQFIEVTNNAGAAVTEPSTSTPGGGIVFTWPGTTTGVLGTDFELQYRVYAPEFDIDDDPVIAPATGASAPARNEAEARGDYDDSSTVTPVSAQDEHTLTLRSIAVQKGVELLEDKNAPGISPGDILEYTISFQISDYFAFKQIVLTDVVGDGQTFLDSFVPQLSVTENGVSGNWGFDGSNYTSLTSDPALGETTLVFDVSKLLDQQDFGYNGDGSLEGDIYRDGNWDEQPATGSVIFRTVIDEAYDNPSSYPDGDKWLGSGDGTGNSVAISGYLLEEDAVEVTDSSHAGVTISRPSLFKRLYAIEGSRDFTDTRVAPGQTATYSLRVEIPAGEDEQLVLTDYLPIPFLEATELTAYDSTQSDTPPAAGKWKLAADDTLSALAGLPLMSTDATQNTVKFDWGSFHEENATRRVAHVLFTLTATDKPMADDLFLANVAIEECQNSEGASHQAISVDYVKTSEPFLTITKGISNTSGGGTINPPPSELPIDGDLAGADADDTVTYVITVENQGSWPAYDVTIAEETPEGLHNCAIVPNGVKVNSVSTSAYSGALFSGDLLLTDPLLAGAILTIEYECTIDSDVYPRQELVNWARVTRYTSTGESGAPNFVQDQSLYEDNATVTIAAPEVSKALYSSSEDSTSGAALTIGEEVTFEFTVTLPESEMTNLTLTDNIPTGFRYEDASLSVVTIGSAVTLGTPTITPASPYAFSSGEDVSITFEGKTKVTSAASIMDRQVTLQLTATVMDDSSNSYLTPAKSNAVALDWDENPGGPITDELILTIVEPHLTVTKKMSPNPATGGQMVTITLTVANSGTSTAFDLVVTDILNTTVFDTATVSDTTVALNGFTFNYAAPTVTYTGGTIAASATQEFTFTVSVKALVITGSTYPNTGTADYSSLPEDEDDERDYTSAGSQDLSISRTSIGKAITATSEPDDISSGSNVVIGEVITYQVTLQLPAESTTNAMKITDDLASNVAYITGTAEIARSSTTVTSTTFTEWATTPGDFAAITPTDAPDPLSFALGTVVNSSAESQTLTFQFDVVVRNATLNQRGTLFSNQASVTFQNDQGQDITVNSNPVSSTIKAPALRIDKKASPAAAIGGDTITFTVEIENQSLPNAGPVFDLQLKDTLSTYYGTISNLSWVVTGTGLVITDNTALNTLDILVDRLDPGEKVVFTFDAVLTNLIPHGATVPNTSSLTGTSLPGTTGTGNATPGAPGGETGERTGTGDGANNLHVSDPAQVSIDEPSMEKAIVSPQPHYPIGATLTFEIVASVPTGESSCLKVEDSLPAGLEFVPGSVQVTVPTTITIENLPADETNSDFFAVDDDLYRFQFGQVVASQSADLIIHYDAIVANILSNQNGTMLQNSAILYRLDQSGGCVPLKEDSATATVGEPYIAVKKQVLSNSSGLTNGDLVDFQIDITNTGYVTAYDLVLTDTVSHPVFGAITAHSVDSSISPVPTFNAETMVLGPFDLPPGEWVKLLFTTELSALPGGATVTNTASATFNSQPEGEGRTGVDGSNQDDNGTLNNYNTDDKASFQADSKVGLSKEVSSCHQDNRFAIGQVVRFWLEIDLLEVTTENMVVIDTLPDFLTPLPTDATVSVGNAGMWFEDPGNAGSPQPDYNVPQVAGQVLTFHLGNVHNPANGIDTDDFIGIEISAQVQNVVQNQNGTTLTNEAEVWWTVEGDPSSLTDSASISVVEPDLEILKSASKTELTIGDEVTYSITVQHTADSTADAYDLVIIDTLAANMSYVSGSCSLPAALVTHTPGSPEKLRFELPALSLADRNITFTYRCVLDYDEALVDPPVVQRNQVLLTYTSLPDEVEGERTGEDGIGGTLDDYADDADNEITPTIRTTIRAEKTVVDANGGELIGGDTLIYTITLTSTDGTAHNVVYSDAIPAWTIYVPATLSTDKVGATVDDLGDPLIVYVGDMAQDEAVTITFKVKVYAQAPKGTIISNQGVVDSDDTTPFPTDDPDDPTSDTDPTDIVVDRPLPMPAVGGESFRPDKAQVIKHWLLNLLGLNAGAA